MKVARTVWSGGKTCESPTYHYSDIPVTPTNRKDSIETRLASVEVDTFLLKSSNLAISADMALIKQELVILREGVQFLIDNLVPDV